ncbi:ATP-binding protein [Chromobacterium sp. TRC.1.1.SA]|uniref:ATP-binding protein n=1 Tax=Chromobacterium indicum TaxID=3110228 RepID=A0ABV0CKS4_9NEIS|nr:ATP-binding protein [Chromobacterium violaceum]MBX9298995.1 ATP-binding protein [Chromobacterium vaccinii]MBX9355884.1 ATP-binding protein [Chromobacterium vaccinii]
MDGLNKALRYFDGLAVLGRMVPAMGVCAVHGEFGAELLPGREPICLKCSHERERERRMQERREMLLQGCGIPGRYRQAKFRDLQPVCEAQAAVIEAFKGWVAWVGRDRNAGNVVITGGPGTGKTHMASAATLNLIGHRGLGVRYVTADQMRTEICETWGRPGRSEHAELSRFAAYPVLIIDEVEILDPNGHGLRYLNRVVDSRSAEGLPTVYISNQTKDGLRDMIGYRAVSRMYENALILQCSWGDYRDRRLAG